MRIKARKLKKSIYMLPSGIEINAQMLSNDIQEDQYIIEQIGILLMRYDKARQSLKKGIRELAFPRLDKINQGRALDKRQKGCVIYDIAHTHKIVISQNDSLYLDDKAEIAKNLIDDYMSKYLVTGAELPEDTKALIDLLQGVITSRHRRLRLTNTMFRFLSCKFDDATLQQAQSIIQSSIQVRVSRRYAHFYCKRKGQFKAWLQREEEEGDQSIYL